MPLPDTDHYALEETAERWQTTVAKLRYYATHNLLEIMTWLDVIVKRQAAHGSSFDSDQISYEGYAIIKPSDIRRILRGDNDCVRTFSVPVTYDTLEIHPHFVCHKIIESNFVISRDERDRFEAKHDVFNMPEAKAMSFPGRPSTMFRVKQHFQERCEQGILLPTLEAEASYLSQWAEHAIHDGQPPRAKTIKNALRLEYRQYIHEDLSA